MMKWKTWGFHIPKIWQISKYFAGAKTLEKTFYFWGFHIHICMWWRMYDFFSDQTSNCFCHSSARLNTLYFWQCTFLLQQTINPHTSTFNAKSYKLDLLLHYTSACSLKSHKVMFQLFASIIHKWYNSTRSTNFIVTIQHLQLCHSSEIKGFRSTKCPIETSHRNDSKFAIFYV